MKEQDSVAHPKDKNKLTESVSEKDLIADLLNTLELSLKLMEDVEKNQEINM